jgi:hypothetical protein
MNPQGMLESSFAAYYVRSRITLQCISFHSNQAFTAHQHTISSLLLCCHHRCCHRCAAVMWPQTALTHGVWVGQQQARNVGGGELLLGYPRAKQNNLERVVKALGFDFETWDPDKGEEQDIPTKYMLWMKQQIIAGRAVIFGARLEGDEDDEWYDHIMPAYGIYYDNSTAGQYDAGDTLFWTDDFG